MRFLNIHHARETIGRLVAAVTEQPAPAIADLPAAYRNVVSTLRPLPVDGEGIKVSFKDSEWGRYLIENRTFENIFEGLEDSPTDLRDRWRRDFSIALLDLRDTIPDLGALVDLVTTDVVFWSSANKGGGTGSILPGLVSMSPGDAWKPHDYAESLVHETIHLNVFSADMVYRLYRLPAKELEAEEYRVLSAVKVGELRPLDKAFHSAVVAPPLMLMQHLRGETELVDKFSDSIRACTDGLLTKLDVFSPYGQLLVRELADFAETLDFDLVKRSISDQEFAHYELPAAA
ncbi:HEXXH motif-containing putative peptide modification protein [Kitasatospora purpeofusca]|uniref:aKG-HExxH-type peptide beta-hydroxylase n=1 Tax=Kitasatospora purpeofusca TaxID=67352 RepID=UPI002257B2D7|nr:HEXXH motif-containing putative peptide modification protein [Kitasatospora purpeofusca]MCX4685484.1 HEXXH motif-containing putative peptide modification protein [Kitasatospora purpeofusca]